MADALVVTADFSPVATAGQRQTQTMTPEGRLRVDAALSVADVELTIAEYTEDAAAASDPTGPVTMLVRRDTLTAAEVSANGDNVAWKGTNKGEGRTNDADANTILGVAADAASATTTIKAALRGMATALGITALDLGSGTGGTRTLRTTLDTADPAVAALGATTGTKVVTDANGTIQQYLRGIVTFLANALGAGTAAAANRVTLASDDPAVATLGATTGTKVVTDANGTVQQYLRGLVTFFANALGAGTAAAAFRVVVATDQTALPIAPAASATGGYSFLNIAAGQATTVVKASAGTLHSIILNSAATAANTTTIYDHASGVGTVIGRPAVTTATVPTTLLYDLAFANGLTIITATQNGGDMTVCYK